jgi:hypothetical protein
VVCTNPECQTQVEGEETYKNLWLYGFEEEIDVMIGKPIDLFSWEVVPMVESKIQSFTEIV